MKRKNVLALLLTAAMIFTSLPYAGCTAYAESTAAAEPANEGIQAAEGISEDTAASEDTAVSEDWAVSTDETGSDQEASQGTVQSAGTVSGEATDPFGHVLIDEKQLPDKDMPEVGDGGVEAAGFEVPASYRSPYVTSIKNQKYAGWCWDFSACAAAESDIVEKGIDKAPDIAEKQIAYWLWHPFTDPKGCMNDGDEIKDSFDTDRSSIMDTYASYDAWSGNIYNLSSMGYTQMGGAADTPAVVWATGAAGAREDQVSNDSIDPKDIIGLGLYGKGPAEPDCCLSGNTYQMKNAIEIPMDSDHELVKKLIMEYGGAKISYKHLGSCLNTSNGAYYNPAPFTGTNHAVEVVGWDDDYSKSNFLVQPEGNGAWIIKNSWGSESGNGTDKGYVYISYYDTAMSANKNLAIFFDMTKLGRDDYYQNQYSYSNGMLSVAYSEETFKSCGNMFTVNNAASGNETLRAVASWVKKGGTAYNIRIYTGMSDSNPASGTLIYSGSENVALPGYHTFVLDKASFIKGNSGVLSNGTEFFVELTAADDGNAFCVPEDIIIDTVVDYSVIPYDISGNGYKDLLYGGRPYFHTSCAGKSYILTDGKWQKDDSDIRISAFTDDGSAAAAEAQKLSFNETFRTLSADVASYASVSLDASISLDGFDSNQAYTWSSSDTDVATVDVLGKVHVYKPGKTRISVVSGNGARASADLTFYTDISSSSVTAYPTLDSLTCTYSMGAKTVPDITLYYNKKYALKQGTDYIISTDAAQTYNAGSKVSFSIIGQGVYKGSITGKTYTIEKLALSANDLIGINEPYKTQLDPAVYTGEEQKPVKKVYYGKQEISADDYTVSYADNKEPGVAVAKITAKGGNLTGTGIYKFYISKVSISSDDVQVSGISDALYNGKAISMDAAALSWNGRALSADEYSLTYENNTEVGTADIVITGKGSHFTDTRTEHFRISPLAARQKTDITSQFTNGAGKSVKKYRVLPGSYASISSKGVITPKRSGKIKVIVYYKDGTSDSVYMKIAVPKLHGMSSVKRGETMDANSYLTGNTGLTVTKWTSSKPAVVQINAATGEMTVVKSGTARITAYYGEGKNAAKYTASITARLPYVTPARVTLKVNRTKQLSVRRTDLDVTGWSSSDKNVAEVDDIGMVTAKGKGTATISAVVDGVTYDCTVKVR